MADAELLKAMGALQIDRPDSAVPPLPDMEHRVIELTFPIFGMTQPGEELAMEASFAIEYRARPPQEPRELSLSDVDFSIALSVEQAHLVGFPLNFACYRLLWAVKRVSEVEIFVLYDGTCSVAYPGSLSALMPSPVIS